MTIRFAAVAACVLAGTATAPGDVLTFDDLLLPAGTVITTQYAPRGVVFSPLNGQLELRSASNPLFPGEPIGLAEIPYFNSVIIATFSQSVTAAGAWIDFGGFGLGVRIEAFDGPGATGSVLASASTQTESFLGVQGLGIRSVRFTNVPGGSPSYLIDNFTFTPVPGPGSGAVVAIGMLGAFRRRRAR